MKKKSKKILLILLVIVLAVSVGAILLFQKNKPKQQLQPDSNASDWNGEHELDKRKTEVRQIAIPGIDSLFFKADQKEQKVNFYNPKSNECLMVFVLYVDDREMWRSGYCKPDSGYYTIELNEPLKEGEYDANLMHECYREDGAVLNSANVKFKLYVQ